MYKLNDIKATGFRITKKISKEIQRDDSINPLVKMCFRESNQSFNEIKSGEGEFSYLEDCFFTLNNHNIDNEYMIEKIGGQAYSESLNEIEKIINRVILQEGMQEKLVLREGSARNEQFKFGNKLRNKYLQLNLDVTPAYLSESVDVEDFNNQQSNDDVFFRERNYYKIPENPGESISDELAKEIQNPSDNYVANVFNNKFDENSSEHDLLMETKTLNESDIYNAMNLEDLLNE